VVGDGQRIVAAEVLGERVPEKGSVVDEGQQIVE
jgi:hypothetical protein